MHRAAAARKEFYRQLDRSNYELMSLCLYGIYAIVITVFTVATDKVNWLFSGLGWPGVVCILIYGIAPIAIHYIDIKIEHKPNFFGAISGVILPFMVLVMRRISILYPRVATIAFIVGLVLFIAIAILVLPDDKKRRSRPIERRITVLLCNTKRLIVIVALVTVCAVSVGDKAIGFAQGVWGIISPGSAASVNGEESEEYIGKLNPQDWGELSRQERLAVVQFVVNAEIAELGIAQAVPVQARQLGENTNGQYSHQLGFISIDKDYLMEDDFQEVVCTTLHEVRHCYQHHLVDAYQTMEKQYTDLACWNDARLWLDAINSYNEDSEDYIDYYFNEIEVDARQYARENFSKYIRAALNQCVNSGFAIASEAFELNGHRVVVVAFDDYIQLVEAGDTVRIITQCKRTEQSGRDAALFDDIEVRRYELDKDRTASNLMVHIGSSVYTFRYNGSSYDAITSEWRG